MKSTLFSDRSPSSATIRLRNLSYYSPSPGSPYSSATSRLQNLPYYSPSPRSAYSSSTVVSSRKSVTSTTPKNPVKSAARFIAALVRCFSPPGPEKISTNAFRDFSVSDVSSSDGGERRRSIYNNSNPSTHSREPGSVKFTMEEIQEATRNFSPTFEIGQGGFGTVYKGRLEDGTLVAVKCAKKTGLDKHLGIEFQNEVQTLAKVEHLNLVKFYGYLKQEDEKILVVEYVSNETLREHLDCVHGKILDFASRIDIAIDVAHEVTYLHMYTDIKSSNILLTENLRAKVADFGFARMAADTESGATHVSTQVKGTIGYIDPDYLQTYQLTVKSDVYSFGVLLIELITGRRPIELKREIKERITTKWAMKKFSSGEAVLALDDKVVKSPVNKVAIEKIFELCLQCLAPQRQSRPSMRKCSEILWSIRKGYKELLSTSSSSDTT